MDSQGNLDMILLLALLPAIGSIAGCAIAEWRQPGPVMRGAALHTAAGIATAVAAIELIPRAEARIPVWMVGLAVLVGAVASIGLFRLTGAISKSISNKDASASLWSIYAVVALDLLIDGLMTGSGGAVASELGFLLATSQVIANLPGGFASTANFRQAGIPRKRRFLLALAFPTTPVIGAAAGFLLLRDAAPQSVGFILAFLAGLLLLATVEDLLPEADVPGAPRRVSSPAYAGGFVLLMLMSAYFVG